MKSLNPTCVACCTHIIQFLACRYVFYSRGGLRTRQYGGLFRDSLSRKSKCAGWNLCTCPHQSKFCYEDVSCWLSFFPYAIYSLGNGIVVFGHGSMAFGFVYTKNHNAMAKDYNTFISYFSSQSCDGGFVLVSASILGVGVSVQGYSCRNMVEMVC